MKTTTGIYADDIHAREVTIYRSESEKLYTDQMPALHDSERDALVATDEPGVYQHPHTGVFVTIAVTPEEIGTKIGKAIARDTLADHLDPAWAGITAEDADQIPEGMDIDEVEQHAKAAYEAAIRLHPTMRKIIAMADAINGTTGAVETIAGGTDGIDAAAAEWVAAGFSPDVAREWWSAGAFDADRAAELRDAGLNPGQCAEHAYAHSNGDMTTDAVVAACQ